MTTTPTTMTRRNFNKGVLLSLGALIASCTPAKILFKAYPEEFKSNHSLQDEMLRAFAVTIVPGADRNTPKLTQIYYDEYYPFAAFVPFFISDLDSRTKKLFAGRSFPSLSQAERERVVLDAFRNGDSIIQRIYHGAIYMTRLNIYAGIYDDSRGCPHINFHGTSQDFVPEQMYYPNAKQYFARQTSLTGNPS